MNAIPTVRLNDGSSIPQLGFGTFRVDDADAETAVTEGLRAGYRHIDTAAIYENEAGVGRAIAASGIPREELYITTKLWNDKHSASDARIGITDSLRLLGLEYVDLYLIHWPATIKYGDSFIKAWDALQDFKAEGLTKAIGVSNFHPHHLDLLNGAVPAINQIELHPSLTQEPLRAELSRRGITVEAWTPLGKGRDLTDERVTSIAADLGVRPAQVVLRWHLQQGIVAIPKTVTPARMVENLDVFGFELTDDQIASITSMNADRRVGSDPDTAEF